MNKLNNLLVNGDHTDLVGKTYSNITILGLPFRVKLNSKESSTCVICECKCGKVFCRKLANIINCQTREPRKTNLACDKCSYRKFIKHGKTHTPLYQKWGGMFYRCKGGGVKQEYKSTYLDKGIVVCDEWKEYINFQIWAYKNGYYEQDKDVPYKERLSIDRIDPNGNYCPENCRIISMRENARHVTEGRNQKIKKLEQENQTYLCLLSTILYSLQPKG